MVRVGITGGIGSGKSTVTALLQEAIAATGIAVAVVDADAIAREVVEPDGPAFAPLVTRFGDGIVGPDGRLDRQALADIVFADEQARLALREITHPAITAAMTARVAATPDGGVCLMDVPLLVEDQARTGRSYDLVIVVTAPAEVKLDRLEARGLRRDDAAARMAAQTTDEERVAVADCVVANAHGIDELRAQVAQFLPTVMATVVATRAAQPDGAAQPAT